MASREMRNLFAIVLLLLNLLPITMGANGQIFREYIGALVNGVKLSEVPINPAVEVHFILSFGIDYTESASPSPTDGKFNIFWDTSSLTPGAVQAIKAQHKNVKVALSLRGDTVKDQHVQFKPTIVSSWVSNAFSSLSKIIKDYHLDGIDIDYEHFQGNDGNTFVECIGQLITKLKESKAISFASIAPFDDGGDVKSHYTALWNKYGRVIDYVNFQFYADESSTVSQFIQQYNTQASLYKGGTVLVSFSTVSNPGGLLPERGFFEACNTLKQKGELKGIFIWCADSSKSNGFKYEKQAQLALLK